MSSITPSKTTEAVTADQILAGISLAGYNAIVTGASSGIGVAIASALAGAGANVTLAVRDSNAGGKIARAIADERGVPSPRLALLDLLSMALVRQFAKDWGDRPLHLLINNAGLMGPPLAHTEDGFESQMSVNYFGPFLLSELLLPNLLAAAPSRVVIVSSGAHHMAELRLDDLNYYSRDYDKFEAYGHSKLCANLLAVEYSRRHSNEGVVMKAVTPAGVMTNLGRHATFEDAVRLGWINEDGSLPQGEMKTVEQGAASTVWAAVSPELEGKGGHYIEDCAIAPVWAPPAPPGWGVTAASIDPEAARALWDVAYPLIASAGESI